MFPPESVSQQEKMARSIRIAVYPGTFDPITLGHLDVLRRSSHIFDKVIVAVAPSDSKNPWFSLEERLAMARESCKGIRNVQVKPLEGLTVEFARRHKAAAIIRGLRKFSDFEFEFDLAHANRLMAPEVETVILMPSQDQFVTSSSFVKDIARHKLSQAAAFVPRCVLPHLRKRLAERA
jgi:pantetheine-phosphate adenylyltransferase